ncbi:MAG: lytic transglycosylase domain-containing protein [Elusimicrobia bacterium]|nr:lytic transglycosylase domain-containing protein [Elusimicrobiota bacterium]
MGAVAAALAAVPAAAQEPRLPTLAVPSGAAAGARLGQIFDAAPARSALPDAGMVTAPRMSERAPALPAETDARPAAARLHQDLVVPVPVETPAYRHTFKVLLSQPEKTDRYDDLIYKYARRYHLDARFLKSIMAAESEFDTKAVSPAGARGLMQVMPVTAEGVGVRARDLRDPEQGIKAGAAYIQELFKTAWRIFHLEGVRYTDVPHWVMQRVIAAYHAGPKFLTRKRWFASTRAYVRKVVLFYHSKVTDLRRPTGADREVPTFSEAVAPGGTLY